MNRMDFFGFLVQFNSLADQSTNLDTFEFNVSDLPLSCLQSAYAIQEAASPHKKITIVTLE
ncbi:MAG: hypothetical protein HAW67_00720 [Endozoicomonadaceae bacterium]|nr:hypothetical protein [Endozoicomonadaceae bacterium]